jgi:hypothetical protein
MEWAHNLPANANGLHKSKLNSDHETKHVFGFNPNKKYTIYIYASLIMILG